MRWQLQTAKQKFSELVDRAVADGPQVVTRRGEDVVVVVAIDAYRRLREREPDFKEFLRSAPEIDSLEIVRDADRGRPVEL